MFRKPARRPQPLVQRPGPRMQANRDSVVRNPTRPQPTSFFEGVQAISDARPKAMSAYDTLKNFQGANQEKIGVGF